MSVLLLPNEYIICQTGESRRKRYRALCFFSSFGIKGYIEALKEATGLIKSKRRNIEIK